MNIKYMAMAVNKMSVQLKIRILMILLIIAIAFPSFAQTVLLNKVISIEFEKVKLSKALELIGEKANINFGYNSKIIDQDELITGSFNNYTIENIIFEILRKTNIGFKEIDEQIFFYKKEEKVKNSKSKIKEIQIQGLVLSTDTNEPIPFAHVFINNTRVGTYTNALGSFSLKTAKQINELIVTHVGYKRFSISIELPLKDDYEINLEPSDNQLNEVIVTAGKDKLWKKHFKLFKKEFLGFSQIAKKCKIVNPYSIDFELKKSNLVAKASEPIIIENMATGYRMQYYLENFNLNLQSMMPTFYGYCSFKEIDTSNYVLRRKWKENRAKSYYGSLDHFVSSLLKNQTAEEGFLINDLNKISVVFDGISKKFLVYIKGEVIITYLKENEPLDYKNWINRSSDKPVNSFTKFEKPKEQRTILKPLDDFIILDQKFQILNKDRILQKGYLGWERMAEALPLEYIPSQ